MKKCNELYENFRRGLITDVEESSRIINQSSIDLEEHMLIMKEHIRNELTM